MGSDIEWPALLTVGLAYFAFLFLAGCLAKTTIEGLLDLFSWGDK